MTRQHSSPQQSPFDQRDYQVRFEWGVDGLARLAATDIVVVVDVIRFSSTVVETVAAGASVALAAAAAESINGAAVAAAAGDLSHEPQVYAGALRNASAVATAVLAEQAGRGIRTSVAIIAAGELSGRGHGAPVRFAVEDLLGAGAIINALIDLGIDHCSPEAVVAAEGFRSLRGAVRHLLTACGSGRELQGERYQQVLAAAQVDDLAVVPQLHDSVFAHQRQLR